MNIAELKAAIEKHDRLLDKWLFEDIRDMMSHEQMKNAIYAAKDEVLALVREIVK